MRKSPHIHCLITLIAIATGVQAQEETTIRVYIPESNTWTMSGPPLILGGIFGGIVRGGARPQKAEIVKTFNKRCPIVVITSNQKTTDYTFLLEREGGKGGLRRDNKFVVYDRQGDAIKSGSTRMLGNAVKDACQAITTDSNRGLKENGRKP